MSISIKTKSYECLTNVFSEEYKEVAKDLYTRMIREYRPKNMGELTLIEMAVRANVRSMHLSKEISELIDWRGSKTRENVAYLDMLSKQVDREDKKFILLVNELKKIVPSVICL